MAKLTLNNITSGFTSTTATNANNTLIVTAMENTLSRDGTSPNTMGVNIDMNSHRIINVAAPVNDNDVARKIDADPAYAASAASAAAALVSQNSATASASTATTQAGIATTQAGIATTQAGIATTQAGTAATQASNSATSAAAALVSQNAAADSAATASSISISDITHAATSKVTPVDADETAIADSGATFGLKKLTWANLKATLVVYLSALTSTWAISTTGNATTATNLSNTASGKLPTIMATVASSALTIGASSIYMNFRSDTLGSGAISTINAAPANLVVPSTATLGTVSTQISRLIIIEMNNAGVAELAVINQAGGNNLDETTLISTTAISATAIAANVIYSTAARTGLPFRVIGFIESTQATAGTWATTPSTIQGAGGNSTGNLIVRNALNVAGVAPMYACRAWVNFNGTGVVAIRASGNVSSITDNGVGDYTVNFTTSMPDANYSITGTSSSSGAIFSVVALSTVGVSNLGFRTANTATGAPQDETQVNVVIFR